MAVTATIESTLCIEDVAPESAIDKGGAPQCRAIVRYTPHELELVNQTSPVTAIQPAYHPLPLEIFDFKKSPQDHAIFEAIFFKLVKRARTIIDRAQINADPEDYAYYVFSLPLPPSFATGEKTYEDLQRLLLFRLDWAHGEFLKRLVRRRSVEAAWESFYDDVLRSPASRLPLVTTADSLTGDFFVALKDLDDTSSGRFFKTVLILIITMGLTTEQAYRFIFERQWPPMIVNERNPEEDIESLGEIGVKAQSIIESAIEEGADALDLAIFKVKRMLRNNPKTKSEQHHKLFHYLAETLGDRVERERHTHTEGSRAYIELSDMLEQFEELEDASASFFARQNGRNWMRNAREALYSRVRDRSSIDEADNFALLCEVHGVAECLDLVFNSQESIDEFKRHYLGYEFNLDDYLIFDTSVYQQVYLAIDRIAHGDSKHSQDVLKQIRLELATKVKSFRAARQGERRKKKPMVKSRPKKAGC